MLTCHTEFLIATIARRLARLVVALWLLGQIASGAQAQSHSSFSYPAYGFGYPFGFGYSPGLGFATTGQSGVLVNRNGWPTIYSDAPSIGVFYDNNPPYYYTPPYSPGVSGRSPWWYGDPPSYGRRYSPGTPLIFNDSPWYWPRTYEGPPLIEVARRTDPALAGQASRTSGAAPPPPPTQAELGAQALKAGEYERAAGIFARLASERRDQESSGATLSAPDRSADRLRVLALVGARQFDEAVAALLFAEREEPGAKPLNGLNLLAAPTEMRRLVNGAVTYANRTNTPDAWRLVAFLMDAEQRPKPAARMRQRADSLENPSSTSNRSPPTSSPEPRGPARFSMPGPPPLPAPDSDLFSPEPEEDDADAGQN